MQFPQARALLALLTSVGFLLAGPARQEAKRLARSPTPPRVRVKRAAYRVRPKLAAHRAPHRVALKVPADYAAWSHVAGCESGGWQVLGGAFPDSLGISRANFVAFGGAPLPPGPVSLANRIKQIQVADRLIASYRAPIPDQYGCAAW